MGITDIFTSEQTVELKHGEYYELMKGMAMSELLAKGIKGEVPVRYLKAFITGEMEKAEGLEVVMEKFNGGKYNTAIKESEGKA